MKQSETKIIKRSQINLNPSNPKKHSDEQIKRQKKNIKSVGYLGGIVFNETTGNLVDGHRRIAAIDELNKYDGSPETDYDIKVEVVKMERKQELEQLTFMALANSKADYNLVAQYLPEIDYSAAGLTQEDYDAISELIDFPTFEADDDDDMMASMDDEFLSAPKEREEVFSLEKKEKSFDDIAIERENQPHMTKEQVKAEKAHCQNVASNHHDDSTSYAMIRFTNDDEKEVFCDIMKVPFSINVVVEGKDILDAIG